MKPDNEKYVIISPDGLPLTHEPFKNKKAALDHIPKYREGLEHQGYYAAVGRRIPLDELAGHLTIVPESEALEVMGTHFDQDTTRNESPLARLMKKAERLLRGSLSIDGEVPPTLLMAGPNGMSGFSRDDLADEAKKQEFLTTGRAMCAAQMAEAAVFCSGGWVRMRKKGEATEAAISAEDSRDREEVAILLGESREGKLQRILPVQRSDEGEFLGFGKAWEIGAAKVTGAFGNFLMPEVPDEEMRLEAERYLEATKLRAVRTTRERGFGKMI